MTSSRAHILESIRRSLAHSRQIEADGHSFEHQYPAPSLPGDGQRPDIRSDDPKTLFADNFLAVGGKLTTVKDQKEACQAVQDILDRLFPKEIAVSDSQLVDAIVSRLETKDAAVHHKASISELFKCGVGITAAQWGIAETGTLVLESAKDCSRLTSLVPDVHVCILQASQIVVTMSEVLTTMRRELSPAVTFITGPSRTSDIELTLAIGVHGPRELHLVLIDPLAE